ncbi:hypothetical protein ABL78_1762 [Leptomonas seymouri]|uniref:Homologous recombination OB-fold protein OB-fold domain-containing protein n=1 Tax=Leptomonas seymouri TaxID=5684 RepID=A0A0N1I1R0_LEPSE|nr:hypothetical protein ABL78_1762 [Leptomonas seymouri]|eukprot:KPI89118.1 hypothetical protein ABL78_1762 [Leptomonas seymouri]
MDAQKVLESLAREKGLPLTGLGEVSSRFSKSGKIACCGGLMTRLVTESAADSTVLLRDGSGSCYCALHGDIASRYPDVLTTGAMLLFTDITVLVLSSKMPPLLVACLQNLSGLLLPEEASTAAAAVMDTGDSVVVPAEAAMDSAASETPFCHSANPMDTGTFGEVNMTPVRSRFAMEESSDRPHSVLPEGPGGRRTVTTGIGDTSSETFLYNAPAASFDKESHQLPASKKARLEETMTVPIMDESDDDDAECLELVDDF